jgi:phage shock protein C
MENNNQQPKILYRSNTNRVIFGVCGGLGEYFNIDPILFRIIFIALVFGAGSGILIYLILAFLIPRNPSSLPADNKPETIDVKKRMHDLATELRDSRKTSPGRRRSMLRLFLGLLIVLIGFDLLAQNFNLLPGFHFFSAIFNFWPVLIILIGLSLLFKGMRAEQSAKKR